MTHKPKITDTDYYIGFTAVSIPEATRYVQIPDAPGNYKRPEAIRDYQDKAVNDFLDKAHLHPMTGSIDSVMIIDSAGDPVFSAKSTRLGEASEALVKFLTDPEIGFEVYPQTLSATFSPRRRLWGIEIERDLRIAGIEVLKRAPGLDVPVRLWHRNGGAIDPYDILLGTGERRIIGMEGLCLYFDLAPLAPNGTAEEWAEFARRLVIRGQLTIPL